MHQMDMITRAAAGDRDALTLLIAAYRQEAALWARDILWDAHLAEDAVQDSLLRLASFPAFGIRSAYNISLNKTPLKIERNDL